jgi:uncharacterized surface anchored protein
MQKTSLRMGLASRALRTLLAVLIAAALIPITALLTPTPAHAATSEPPPTLTGRFTLAPGFTASPAYQGDFPGTVTLNGGYTLACFGNNSGGDNGRASCISHGAANWGDPANLNNRSGTVNATYHSSDPARNIAWYRMTVTPDLQPAVGATGVQYLGNTWLAITWDFEGWIRIVKSSARPDISEGNGDYSLAGAVYEVRRASDKALVATLTTDASGEAVSPALEAGSYYLTEIVAPKGFAVDVTAHNVTVVAGETTAVAVTDTPLGWIEIVKSSANTGITDGNACYSLVGAVYGVYASAADAASHANRITALTTDAGGFAKSPRMLEMGDYFVREVTAPKGYARDAAVYPVVLNAAKVRLEAKDVPQGDPAAIVLEKVDADSAQADPQGAASLEGALFAVSYFDGYYDTPDGAKASGLPTRVWVLKTDKDGMARLRESYLAEGSDPLYENSSGDATIPLGTVLIQETAAPQGYVLPAPAPVFVRQITATGFVEDVHTYNAPIIPDAVVRGDVAIIKVYDPTPQGDTGEMAPEENVTFDFYGSHQFMGSKPNARTKPAFSITTDAKGHADTTALYVTENADGSYSERPRKKTDTGGIPYGTYLMVQRSAPAGFETVVPVLVSVLEDGRTYSFVLQNGVVQTPIKVIKTDSESGRPVPYPASWQIISKATGKPVEMTVHYPTTQVLDTFTSDAEGRLTLPEPLPFGDYALHEVTAPASGNTGYVRNPVDVPFATGTGYDWDDPLTITFADAPAKGRIILIKSDAATGGPVAEATYTIRAAGDITTLDGTVRAKDGEVVDTITTGTDGRAQSKALYLGAYTVSEAISPIGYALDTAAWPVTLSYAGQDVAVVTGELGVKDAPSTLVIRKEDALTGQPLAGVSFCITNTSTKEQTTVTTGTEGTATLPYLAHGPYTVTETSVPVGYVATDEVFAFTVDDQGLIDGKASYEVVVKNVPIQVPISKRDITTGAELPGCTLEVYAADEGGAPVGEPLYSWVSTAEPYLITGIAAGRYVLQETMATDGYTTAQDVVFTAEATGVIRPVVMEDDVTRLSISKQDITAKAELPGAKMAVYAADEDGRRTGEALYEWVSVDVPFIIERIPVGDYILHEDLAPLGYELAQDVPFTVTDTGEVQAVVMYDEPTPKEPDEPKGGDLDKTGRLPWPLVAVALVFIGVGGIGTIIGIRRMRRREEAPDEDAADEAASS